MGKEIDFACEKDKKETVTDPGRTFGMGRSVQDTLYKVQALGKEYVKCG